MTPNDFSPYQPLKFSEIEAQAAELASFIEAHMEQLEDVLLEYESHEVVLDETARTLDLLRNLKENKKYFKIRIGSVASFLPRNQPLYSLACFVIIPSLMASEVHFRIPHSMKSFFPKLQALLDLTERFPNINVSHHQRLEFLREQTALKINPPTGETLPVTDAVIFTGSARHAEQLRFIFDRRTLFIANGSGHNPVVVTKEADISKAADAVVALQLYNQGQDCSAPNAILIEKSIKESFLQSLRERLAKTKVGPYRDKKCSVGPISETKDLVRIQDFLIENSRWIDPTTPGVILSREGILHPTIVDKPLKNGGNFHEIFAPIIFVQEYDEDSDLVQYFEDPAYAPHAMFVSIYGTSKYIEDLKGKYFKGQLLHDASSVLYNLNPHDPGVERGTQPYGGYGSKTSSISREGLLVSKPTLPQRDIYEWIVKPLLELDLKTYCQNLEKFTQINQKNVEKLLRINQTSDERSGRKTSPTTYIDISIAQSNGQRYIELRDGYVYHLLDNPNTEFIATLTPNELNLIRALRTLLMRKDSMSSEEFNFLLYVISKASDNLGGVYKDHQRKFFEHIYQLLLGKNYGPRLGSFLWEADNNKVCNLLDV